MLIKASPFSPMEKRQSSSEEEVSADLLAAEEEEKEPEGKNDRKARLVPKKGSQERGRAERRRSRSRRSRSRDRRDRSDRKEKKEKEKNTRDGLRQVVTGADRRLRRVLRDHRHRNRGRSLRRSRGRTLTQAKVAEKTSKEVQRSRSARSAAHASRGLHPLWISISGCPNTAWLGKPTSG